MLSDEGALEERGAGLCLLLCLRCAQQEGTLHAVLMEINTSLIQVLMRLHLAKATATGTLPNPLGPSCSGENSSQGKGLVLL